MDPAVCAQRLPDAVEGPARECRQPNYVQCLLVGRPENKPFGSGVSTVAYEVRKDGSLAQFEQRPVVIREQPLLPSASVPRFEAVRSSIPSMLSKQ